jgi:hypothetical protein
MSGDKCGKTGMCVHLQDRVILGLGGGAGLHSMQTINLTTGKTTFAGVCYKTNAKDFGILINHCPFCGKRPGDWSVYMRKKKGGG